MLSYTRSEARDWARENLKGAANVVIPSYSADLSSVSEGGIRHDVRLEIERGFSGFLLVSETALTLDEYEQFAKIAVDEAQGKQLIIHQASFNTLEENVEAARRAADAGAQLALFSFPPSFYPRNEDDIFEYTRAFCESVDMAVMLFPVPLWNFERIHPASMSIQLMERMVDELPTIVAIKAEGGYPSVGGFVETWKRLGDRVVVNMPIESQGIPLAALVPMQFMGTSNFEYYGDAVPKMLQAAQEGRVEEMMSLFWQIDPARRADTSGGGIGGTNSVNRMAWKYQAWLSGFNGGPLRMPTTRIKASQMNTFRNGLVSSGLPVTDDPDELFYVGRNVS